MDPHSVEPEEPDDFDALPPEEPPLSPEVLIGMSVHEEAEDIESEVISEFVEEQAEEPEEVTGPAVQPVESLETSQAAGQAQEVTVDQLNDQEFNELHLSSDHIHAMRSSWSLLLRAHSADGVGDAIYAALVEAMPSLREMFKTPRAVMSSRMLRSFNDLVAKSDNPAALKVSVEMLAFHHLQIDVTAPRVWLFRDALVEMMQSEIGDSFQSAHKEAWCLLLSYIGGAFIFIRRQFAGRLQILLSSWDKVTTHVEQDETPKALGAKEETPLSSQARHLEKKKAAQKAAEQKDHSPGSHQLTLMEEGSTTTRGRFGAASIPKTFDDMFLFNAAVMGYGTATWMDDVLRAFGPIVLNIANTARLQEECDVLSIILAKTKGQIRLKEFKSVMLATLRSLLPQDWSTDHENAWTWLWDTVERLLKANMGKPAVQEQALRVFLEGVSDEQRVQFRTQTYEIFFRNCVQGQDYFKQSTTRMHFIADKVLALTQDIFKDTHGVIEALSALGLRHVGYGIPTEFFGPFVSAAIQALGALARPHRQEEADPRGASSYLQDEPAAEAAIEAFSWSLSLVSRVLVRTINEGSTVVMKAINVNDARLLRKAVSCAPRGQRARWVLQVQVGTQQISPLMWAIHSGALETAKAILEDLFTIRADRERYYYAADELFERHPDIVERLRLDAPTLLPIFLDGLIWRSRLSEKGQRRVNYYVKHLIVEKDGSLSQSLASIVDHDDPVIMCHPAITLVFDNIWNGVAKRAFIFNKLFFLVCLLIYVLGESVLGRYPAILNAKFGMTIIFLCRIWIYCASLLSLIVRHCRGFFTAIKEHDLVRFSQLPVSVPRYLTDWQEAVGFCLMLGLSVMFGLEPGWRCTRPGTITLLCPEIEETIMGYRWTAMFCNLMYFILVVDLMVISTAISAYVLACGRVIHEVILCLCGLFFNVCTFSCVICCMKQELEDFIRVPNTALALIRLTLGLYSGERLNEAAEYPDLFLFISVYTVISWLFLLNLLVGQMNCIYMATYSDMVGFARLNRGRVMLKTLQTVKPKTWEAYVESLHLEKKLDFNEGDVGLPGGVQRFEPANAHRVTEEQIKRYGGPTDMDSPWPVDLEIAADQDRVELLEKTLQKSMGKIFRAVAGKKGDHGASNAGSSNSRISQSKRSSNGGSSAEEI